MSLKFLIFLTWVFYIMERRTADELWFFCMVYTGVLTICAYFYQREKAHRSPAKQTENAANTGK